MPLVVGRMTPPKPTALVKLLVMAATVIPTETPFVRQMVRAPLGTGGGTNGKVVKLCELGAHRIWLLVGIMLMTLVVMEAPLVVFQTKVGFGSTV